MSNEWQNENSNLGQSNIDISVSSYLDSSWKNEYDNLGQGYVDVLVTNRTDSSWKNEYENLGQAATVITVAVQSGGSFKGKYENLGQGSTVLSVSAAPIPPVPVVPPAGKIFGGRINSVVPLQFVLGAPLRFTVKFEAVTTSLVEQTTGWVTSLVLKLDSMSQKLESGFIFGSNVGKESVLNFDLAKPMPNKVLKGTVTLTALKAGFSSYSEVVATKEITVTLPGTIPPVKPPGSESDSTLMWIGAGALGLVALSSGGRSKKTKRAVRVKK